MNTTFDNMQDTDLAAAINFCTVRSKEAIQAHDWTNLDYWNTRLNTLKQEYEQRQLHQNSADRSQE